MPKPRKWLSQSDEYSKTHLSGWALGILMPWSLRCRIAASCARSPNKTPSRMAHRNQDGSEQITCGRVSPLCFPNGNSVHLERLLCRRCFARWFLGRRGPTNGSLPRRVVRNCIVFSYFNLCVSTAFKISVLHDL